jgi:hypothetical protein
MFLLRLPNPRVSFCALLFCFANFMSISPAAQAQKPIFPSPQTFPLGTISTPPIVATGDFDGDGLPDAVYLSASNNSSETLNVLLNQGPNAPAIPVTTQIPTCFNTQSIVAGDLNQDKKLDLVIQCETDILVFLGKGDGSFESPVTYNFIAGMPTGNPLITQALAPLADLNGDGYPDVIIAGNQTPAVIVVLLNQGKAAPGVLDNPATYATSFPTQTGDFLVYEVEIGDFNGDGKLDVLAGGDDDSQRIGAIYEPQAEILYGNGDGTLQTGQKTSASYPFVVADFNNDGISDIAWLTTNAINPVNTVETLLGTPKAMVLGPTLTLPATQLGANGLKSAGQDYPGGNANLALINSSPQTVTILRGDGNGGFNIDQSLPDFVQSMAAVGSKDGTNFFVLNDSNYIQLDYANPNGSFPGPTTQPTSIYGFASADLNGDGLTDVLFWDGNNNLVTGLALGNGTFSTANQVADPDAQILIPGDFNGDGKLDAAAIYTGQDPSVDALLYYYQGNGDGGFETRSAAVNLHDDAVQTALSGDFNGDGKLDLAVVFQSYDQTNFNYLDRLDLIPGNGNGTFSEPVVIAKATSANPLEPELVADLNGDSKLDLIWNNITFLNNGNGTFKQVPLSMGNAYNFPLAVGDLNGDGIPDIVMEDTSADPPAVYAGNGDGSFDATPFYTAGLPTNCSTPFPRVVGIGDVTGDGNSDLLIPCTSSPGNPGMAVLIGDGKGGFTTDKHIYNFPTSGGPLNGASILTRLNANAPALGTDHALDLLTFAGGATSVLNSLNPIPAIAVSTSTTVTASPVSAYENQPVTLTAKVFGANPSGSVSFTSGSNSLGSGTVQNGIASLKTSFISAGTIIVTASYSGDSSYLPSQSAPLSIVVSVPPPPGLTVTGTAVEVSPGATTSNTSTITVAPTNGFTGSVTLTASITASPAGAVNLPTLGFGTTSPVKITGASAQTATLTISTTAPTSNFRADAHDSVKPQHRRWFAVGGTALACVLLFGIPARKRHWSAKICLLVALALLSGAVLACSGGGGNTGGGGGIPGTTPGGYTATVTATSGSVTASNTITITVQ